MHHAVMRILLHKSIKMWAPHRIDGRVMEMEVQMQMHQNTPRFYYLGPGVLPGRAKLISRNDSLL